MLYQAQLKRSFINVDKKVRGCCIKFNQKRSLINVDKKARGCSYGEMSILSRRQF